MIFGIGVDIVEIGRLRKAHEKWGNRFLRRIMKPAELEEVMDKNDMFPSISARFAAKEAFVKALGTGFSRGISWQDMEVKREKGQRPFFSITGRALFIMNELGVKNIHLSMSHEREYAIAKVVLES